ncbi:MAG: MATE family efflux transporter [Pseudomonadota bacterium]
MTEKCLFKSNGSVRLGSLGVYNTRPMSETKTPPMRGKLTEGHVGRTILGLTVPMFFGISAMIIASLADTWFVAQLGTNELAAISFTMPVVTALTSIIFGIGIGTSSVVARAAGEGDHSQVKRLATDSMLLTFVVTIFLAFIGYLLIESVFAAMGAQPELLPHIYAYMTIWYAGLIFMAVPMVGSNALRALGDARIPALLMSGGAVLNIIFDPILIFGFAGIPGFGLEGAALAMVLSRLITFFIAIAVMHFRERIIVWQPPSFRVLWHSWKHIMYISIPATATNLIGPVSLAIILAMLAKYGPEAVAGFGIAARVEGFAVLALFALSASIGPFVGQNWGARKYTRVRQGLNFSFLVSALWGTGVAALMLPWSDWLAGLFDKNPAVVEVAAQYLMIVPISYVAWGTLMIISATFNALGRPLPSTALSAIRMFALYIPLAFLCEYYMGVLGIFVAAALSNVLIGILAYWWHWRIVRPPQKV